ncbi:extracellular solute-binding protein [Brachybacterium aquaticum]|uniref:Multiple sugar transport system substrate-binding protein n=1 Tax=Brachybacterium aquaticum TaxID=1432564 RepID=A0A841AIY6_9MICO|nr:extracellular solute-binding protein [Brachybacterium aquaticum]MBB5832988.1 multiple sugar transport system substrate-binding protein [Brachybacterium aquaticum]
MLSRRRALQIGAATSVLGLAACSRGGGASGDAGGEGPHEFTTTASGSLASMGFNPSDEVGQARADYAAAQLPDLQVEMDTTNFDSQKFTAQAAAGQVPDLIQFDRALVATFAANGLIMPLDQGFEVHGVDPAAQYYDAALRDVTHDGAIYAVPQFFQPSALLVNTRAAEAAGLAPGDFDTSDPDALLRVVEKGTTMEGSAPVTLGFDGDIPGSAEMWMQVFGGGSVGEDGAPTLDRAENVEALTWIKELLDLQGGYAEVTSLKNAMDVFGEQNQYVTDQVVAQSWAQWYLNVLTDFADAVEIQAVPVRSLDGTAIGFAGGSAFAVPTAAANADGALAWALAATSTEAWLKAGEARQATAAEAGGINTGLFTGSPEADQQVREQFVDPSGDPDFDQAISVYYDVLAEPRSTGSSPVGEQIKQALLDATTAALNGEKEPAQALADAQASAQGDFESAS